MAIATLLGEEELRAVNARFAGRPPEELLEWALERFHPRVALATSFNPEDQVLTHLLAGLRKDARVFTIDTGRLPPETYDLQAATEGRYGLGIATYAPRGEAVEAMVRSKGVNLFYESIEARKECCGVRKVEPLARALHGLDAWITGLRREQNVTRASVPLVELGTANGGIIKLNPLAEWTEQQVWDHVRANNVPVSALHSRGYRSIGCAPCTRAVLPGEDARAGRWWWENPESRECGLHVRAKVGP